MLKRWVVVFAAAAAPMFAYAQGSLLIAGGVYEDRAALALRKDLLPFAGVTVRLYRENALLATTKTKQDGLYAFRVDQKGDYMVAVDSRTINADAWPEQTFGPAGALCARPDGSTVSIQSEGSCFGGRTTKSDDASSLATSEHVAAVKLDGSLANLDFAFSFDTVTNTADGEHIQGSLRQFLTNANMVKGPNRMRFVPLTPAPEQRDPTMGTQQYWWSVVFGTPLPELKDEDTLIDGVARNYLSPTSVANTNPGRIGDSTTIESEDLKADRIQKPELELVLTGSEGIVCTSRCQMRDFAVRGTPIAIALRADARIEHVLVGASPDAMPSPARGTVGVQIENGLAILHNVLVTSQSNVGIAVGPNGRLQGSRLDVSRCGEPQSGGGIVFLSNGSEVHASLINENLGAGVVVGPTDGSRPVSGNVIDGTTISSNQAGVVLSPGSTRNSITRNDIMWNRLGGVTITPYNDKPAPRENRFSANRYDENGLRPIVLNLESEPNSLARAGDCDSTTANVPNNGISVPLISSAQIGNEDTAALVTIRGRACPGQVVELYQSFVTSSVREKVGVEMPRIRGVKNEVETITNQEREMTLPSIGEFNYIGSANTASDGTFEATFPFLIVKEGADKPTLDVDRDTDIWARDVLRSAKPEERAFSAVAIDPAGNTSEMSVRRKVERRVATREQR
jgi:hypothetical protein